MAEGPVNPVRVKDTTVVPGPACKGLFSPTDPQCLGINIPAPFVLALSMLGGLVLVGSEQKFEG